MNPPPGKTALERLDYSIKRIAAISEAGTNAGKVPPGTNAAIGRLRRHWAEFFASPERKDMPQLLLQRRMDRYAEWYTRAWAILPVAQRALIPSPGEIDVSFERVTAETFEAILERGRTIAEEAKSLRESIDSAGRFAGFSALAGLALGAFAAWYLLSSVRK